MQLNHEKLIVYQTSIQFLGVAFEILQSIPSGYSFLADQLKRAALSIPLNIAEGSGKFETKDKARFYKIARGSTSECGAILDAALKIKIIDKEKTLQGKELLVEIACMLSKMF